MADYCYVGRCAHGVIRTAIVDRPEYQSETAKALVKIVRNGGHVERITIEACRAEKMRCDSCEAVKKMRKKKGGA